MDPILRRSIIGIASGLICSVALVATLHGLLFGVALGVAIGTLYAIAVRPTPFAYAESIFTAAALAIPLWIVLSVIVFPTLAGIGPQWDSQGMRSLFPQFVGWVLYGAALGLVVQALSDGAKQVLGPEPARRVSAEAEKIRIVILGGGVARMTTAENLEQEIGAVLLVRVTLASEGNAL